MNTLLIVRDKVGAEDRGFRVMGAHQELASEHGRLTVWWPRQNVNTLRGQEYHLCIVDSSAWSAQMHDNLRAAINLVRATGALVIGG